MNERASGISITDSVFHAGARVCETKGNSIIALISKCVVDINSPFCNGNFITIKFSFKLTENPISVFIIQLHNDKTQKLFQLNQELSRIQKKKNTIEKAEFMIDLASENFDAYARSTHR